MASEIASTWSGAMMATSGGRANGSRFQNRSEASASRISGRRDPPPQRWMRDGSISPAASSSITSSTPAAQTATSSRTISPTASCSVDREAARVVHLERLGARERQVQAVRDGLGERTAAEREHARPLDAALADEGHVGGPAADVDEQGAGLADVLGAQDAGHGVRLRDDLEQLQVELAGDGLERPEMDQRREGVEDADLDVAALEADRVGEPVAVDRGPHDGAVHEAHVDVREARSPR